MMKNKITPKSNWLVAIALAVQFILTVTSALAQLDETCTVSVNGQTVNVGFGGVFRLDNVPAGQNLVRLYAVCTKDGKTRYGRSGFFQIIKNQTFAISELDMLWRDTPFPSTSAIKAVADNTTLTAIGQTTQIRVIAMLSDSTQEEATRRNFGSTYLSSNSNVATVDQNGLVRAVGPGTVFITVNNEGAAATLRLTVAPPGLLTTVEGIVQNEDGTPGVGAVVMVPGGGETIVTATDGRFSVPGIFTKLGTLAVRAYVMANNQLRLGMTGLLRIITGGITDAGIIVIKPITNYVYWTTPVSGSWTDATKWSTGRVPTTNDNVFIGVPGNITVTFSTGFSTIRRLICDENLVVSGGTFTLVDSSEFATTLTLTGGTLSGTQNRNTHFLIFGQFNWSDGLIDGLSNGSITIAPSGNMNINGSGPGQTISRCTVNIAGSATWSGAANLRGNAPLTFNVLAAGLFEAQNDAVFFSGGAADPIFNNAGTFLKSAGSDTTKFQGTIFNSSGIIDVRSGTLHVSSGGTYTGGDFRVVTGTVLDFTLVAPPFRPYIFSGGFSKSGGGTIHFGNGTFQIAAAGATFNFDGNTLQWTGGTLSGPGVLTNLGTINLSGTGTQTFSSLTLNNTGTIHLGGSGAKTFSKLTLNNNGVVTWSSASNIAGGNGTTLNNLAGGVFDVQNDASLNLGAGGGISSFNNIGTFQKSVGVGLTTLSNIRYNNSGTINVQSGTIRLTGGGNNTGGNYLVASGATLDLTGGTTHTYSGTYTGSGDGTISVANGTMQIATAGATFNFSGNVFQWSGGTLSGPGILTNIGTMNLSGTAAKRSDANTVNNSGTVTWSGTGNINLSSAAIFNNLAGGIFDILNDATIATGFGSAGSFNNAGTVRKSVGTATTSITGPRFNNSGTVEIQSGILSFGDGYTHQTSSSNLNITIRGINVGTGFGQHRTTGGITTLDGNLNVSLNNFTPAVGNSFQVMTFVNRNNTQFAKINLPALPPGLRWKQPVAYTGTSLTIEVEADSQAQE